MGNKITTILDLDDGGFKKTLKGIGSSVGEADGILGKFKAGSKATFDGLKKYAAEGALAAGAALIAFSVKAVGAFTDVAKAALDLSTSTGLAVEDASRWLGVADDFQVTAEAMATGLGKITKTLDDTKWAKYGIDTRDAGGKARDVNDILLDTFDMLSKVTNKTDQARIGQQLFGKGYQSLTPILGHTRAEYEKMLGAVEKGQVITEAEAKKAERMRLAQDQLSDSLKEITLSWGQVVAGMAPAVTESAEAVATFLALAERVDNVTEKIGGLKGILDIVAGGRPDEIFGKMVDVFTTFTPNVEAANEALDATVVSLSETDRETRKLATGMGEVRDREQEAADKAQAYALQVDKTSQAVQLDIQAIGRAWDTLTGNLSNEQAWIQLQQQAEDVKQANLDAGKAIREHGPGSPEAITALQNARLASIGLELATSDYAKEIAGLPPEVATRIAAAIGAGDIDKALADLQSAFDNTSFRANAHLDNIIVDGETHAAGSVAGFSNIRVVPGTPPGHDIPGIAEGGVVRARPGGMLAVIGEGGHDEAVIPLDGKHGMLGNGDGGIHIENLTVVLPPGSDGDTVIRAIKKWENRNGPGWRS